MKVLGFSFYLLIICSCVQRPSIGLQDHVFGVTPGKVIWLQLSAFDSEDLAILDLQAKSATVNSWQNMKCWGQAWEYNLSQLRPESNAIMLAQMTGNLNITGQCSDFKKPPFWNYYRNKENIPIIIAERNAQNSQSILNIKDCVENLNWFPANTYYYQMSNNVAANETSIWPTKKFYFSDQQKLVPKTIYEDRSCQGFTCQSSLKQNFMTFYNQVLRYQKGFIYVLRDFKLEHLLKQNKASLVVDYMMEMNIFVDYIVHQAMDSGTLLIITGIRPQALTFPEQGRPLQDWMNLNKNVLLKPQSLYSKIWATGAASENFCGLYNSQDIIKRLFWTNPNSSMIWKEIIE